MSGREPKEHKLANVVLDQNAYFDLYARPFFVNHAQKTRSFRLLWSAANQISGRSISQARM